MWVWVLAGGVGISVLFAVGCKVGREWQRQNDTVKTIAEGTAEYRLRLHGGPYDGAHLDTTPRVGRPLVTREHCILAPGGSYRLTGLVEMPDGGAIAQLEWAAQ